MGGGIQTFNQTVSLFNKSAKKVAEETITSLSEQEIIDGVIIASQASTTNQRKNDQV